MNRAQTTYAKAQGRACLYERKQRTRIWRTSTCRCRRAPVANTEPSTALAPLPGFSFIAVAIELCSGHSPGVLEDRREGARRSNDQEFLAADIQALDQVRK